jgi:hypothetical protein
MFLKPGARNTNKNNLVAPRGCVRLSIPGPSARPRHPHVEGGVSRCP